MGSEMCIRDSIQIGTLLIANRALYTPSVPIFYLLIDVVDGVRIPAANFFSQGSLYLKLQFAMILFFWTCIWAVKFSFLAFYQRLFDNTTQRWKYIAWWLVTAICVGTYVGCVITQFLACQPFMSYFTLGQHSRVPVVRDRKLITG